MSKVWSYENGWETVEETNAPQLTMGVYELPTGEIYIVKPNKDKTRLYAKKLVESRLRRNVRRDRKQ